MIRCFFLLIIFIHLYLVLYLDSFSSLDLFLLSILFFPEIFCLLSSCACYSLPSILSLKLLQFISLMTSKSFTIFPNNMTTDCFKSCLVGYYSEWFYLHFEIQHNYQAFLRKTFLIFTHILNLLLSSCRLCFVDISPGRFFLSFWNLNFKIFFAS